MGKIMTAAQLVAKAKDIAKNRPSLYVMGAFGAPASDRSRARYTAATAHEYNLRPANKAKILAAPDGTWFFDCVGLIKGLLWGWCGDTSAVYGGATYQAYGVDDLSADGMIAKCSGVSTSFAGIVPGEAVWKSGHIGIYIGEGLAVECTPAWYDKVQITAVGNLGGVQGYNVRTWTKHGKLPWVDYSVTQEPAQAPECPFADVPADTWYTKAVRWAWRAGITSGTDATHFSPNKSCTRAQMAVFLYALAKWIVKLFGKEWKE